MSMSRLLAVASVAALLACSGVNARLQAEPTYIDDFEAQGLEQLETRYGTAFPSDNKSKQQ
jgi:hypothetical protein